MSDGPCLRWAGKAWILAKLVVNEGKGCERDESYKESMSAVVIVNGMLARN